MTENHATRLKRLRLRSWRRGMKEMDLILGGFADARIADLSAQELDAHEALMEEPDQDLYDWISGRQAPPDNLARAVDKVRAWARNR